MTKRPTVDTSHATITNWHENKVIIPSVVLCAVMNIEVVLVIIIIIIGKTYFPCAEKYYPWLHQAYKMLDMVTVDSPSETKSIADIQWIKISNPWWYLMPSIATATFDVYESVARIWLYMFTYFVREYLLIWNKIMQFNFTRQIDFY